MKTIVKILFLTIFVLLPLSATAQNAQKVYSQGLALLDKARKISTPKKRTATCNAAIKKFIAAKTINSEMVADCNKQIGIANALMSAPAPKPKPVEQVVKEKDHIEAAEKSISFAYNEDRERKIKIQSSSNDWTVATSPIHQDWCKVNKTDDGQAIVIKCTQNTNSTFCRNVDIILSGGNSTDEIKVVQKGLPVTFQAAIPKGGKIFKTVRKLLKINYNEEGQELKLEMKKKGDTRDVIVLSNSDSIHNDKKDWKENFKVVKKPEWCEVLLDEVTNQKYKEEEIEQSLKEHTRILKVIAQKIPKSDEKLSIMGRNGVLILRSQEKIIEIPIYQNK